MKNLYPISQLMLRLSIGIGFILPVMDRLGCFGVYGEANVAWGSWAVFVAYTHQLMPYVNEYVASFCGFVATVLEVVCGILLIVGYKVRYTAIASACLTLVFALSMLFFLHFKAPFSYSVFVVSFSSLLLSTFSHYPWSMDAYLDSDGKLDR